MKKWILFLYCITILSCDKDDSNQASTNDVYYKGMDLSFLPQVESDNVIFKNIDNQNITDNYAFLANQGVNLVRIRVWVNNVDGLYNIDFIKQQALRAKTNNMDILVDFHYSNTWADPGQQETPIQWQGMNLENMSSTIKNYTQNVIEELVNQGTTPALVQIGNETNNGMLWPTGIIYSDTGEDWNNYITLTNAAIEGVRNTVSDAKIIIHYAGVSNASYFYEQLNSRAVDYDIAGLSYYPWWHGTDINVMENDLISLANQIPQKIMILETAYPFTLDWDDNTHNIVGLENQLATNFSATSSGQRNFMLRINQIMKNLPNEKGIGFCYWAPDWVASNNSSTGSSWENLTLFNFNHQVNPAMAVFNEN